MKAPKARQDVGLARTIKRLAQLACVIIGFYCHGSVFADPVQEFTSRDSEITLLVNANVSTSELSLGSLRSIFTMRKRSWSNETPITVFVLPDQSRAHQIFCKTILKIYPFVLREQWDRLIFSGTGFSPTIVKDEKTLRSEVANTPGSIGYVLAPAADAAAPIELLSTTQSALATDTRLTGEGSL